MGFPVAYSEMPSLALHLFLLLGHLRRLIAAALRLAGLDDLLLDDLPFDSAADPAAFSVTPPLAAGFSAIDRALPAVLYSDLEISGGSGGGHGCAVCLHDFEPSSEVRRLVNCSHVFHSRCIDSWAHLRRRCGGGGATCPLCRAPLFSCAGADGDDVTVDDVDYLFDDYSALSFPPPIELA